MRFETEKGEPKATRLGASTATANAASNIPKATRLGNFANQAAPQNMETANASAGSFLSNLKPVHYIGAGVGVLILLGALIAVPLIMFGISKKSDAAETKSVEKPKTEEAQKPVVADMPAQITPTPQTQATTTSLPSAPPSASNPSTIPSGTGDLTPVEDKTTASKSADKPTAQKPVSVPVKPAAPAPKPAAPRPTGKKPSAECVLTGNCLKI